MRIRLSLQIRRWEADYAKYSAIICPKLGKINHRYEVFGGRSWEFPIKLFVDRYYRNLWLFWLSGSDRSTYNLAQAHQKNSCGILIEVYTIHNPRSMAFERQIESVLAPQGQRIRAMERDNQPLMPGRCRGRWLAHCFGSHLTLPDRRLPYIYFYFRIDIIPLNSNTISPKQKFTLTKFRDNFCKDAFAEIGSALAIWGANTDPL